MIIPELYGQVNLIFTGFNTPNTAQVTFGINQGAGIADVGEAALAVQAAYQTANMRNTMVTQTTLSGILVKFGPNATGPSTLISPAITGTLNSEPVPPNTSVLVTKGTALGGRSGRGRLFWPSIPEANLDGAGQLQAGFKTTLQTAFDAFRTALDTNEVPMTLLHGDSSAPITAPLTVTTLTVQSKVATQRRRLRR